MDSIAMEEESRFGWDGPLGLATTLMDAHTLLYIVVTVIAL